MSDNLSYRLSKSYKINVLFGLFLFLTTILFRSEIVYGVIDDWGLAASILNAWNWLMLFSLGIAAIRTMILTYKLGSLFYSLLSIVLLVLFIITAIGTFLISGGALLS